MALKTVVRKEYKSHWERRTPLTPSAIKKLAASGIPICAEKSEYRVYSDQQMENSGAKMVDAAPDAKLVLGIKEPLLREILPGQVHLAFSHTIKGQSYNMDLLQAFMDRGCCLIDYEAMKNPDQSRIIAFGRYAGIAGAADTFWAAGRKLALKGQANPLTALLQTHEYGNVADLKAACSQLGPLQDRKLGVVINGTGNVGQGCEDVCRWLGMARVEPQDVLAGNTPDVYWYCMLKTADVHLHKQGKPYDSAEFRKYGSQRYDSCFDRYLGKFDILLQSSYWEGMYPKHLSRERMLAHRKQLPMLVGDVSCDIDGSLACTTKASTIAEPEFTYLLDSGESVVGLSWDGVSVMSVDNLPCELSMDASDHFSSILVDMVPQLVNMDLASPLEACGMSKMLQDATIVYNGKLTEKYAYLAAFGTISN